jgi:hypothetical protein
VRAGQVAMAAVPDEGGFQPPGPPPLGRMLVQRGLLTEEQLAAGLAEHGRTGRPLGQVIVDLGYVPATIVAQALATQHGGLLKTEYGYATGFASVASPAPAAPLMEPPVSPVRRGLKLAPEPAAAVSPAPAAAVAESAGVEPVDVEQVRVEIQVDGPAPVSVPAEQPEELAAATARIAQLEEELVTVRGQLDELRARAADESGADASAAEAPVEALHSENEQLRAALAEAAAVRATLRGRLADVEQRLEDALARSPR